MSVMRFKASRGSGKWSSLSFYTREFPNLQQILLLELTGSHERETGSVGHRLPFSSACQKVCAIDKLGKTAA